VLRLPASVDRIVPTVEKNEDLSVIQPPVVKVNPQFAVELLAVVVLLILAIVPSLKCMS